MFHPTGMPISATCHHVMEWSLLNDDVENEFGQRHAQINRKVLTHGILPYMHVKSGLKG